MTESTICSFSKFSKFSSIILVAFVKQPDGQLPLAYLTPSRFCKEGFSKNENVLFEKTLHYIF